MHKTREGGGVAASGPPALSIVTDSDLPHDPADREPSALACLVIVARHHGVHLSTEQLICEIVVTSREVSTPELVKCATNAGLKTKVLDLDWHGLADLGG